jgi:SAM-dependent methyltransferase
VPTGARWLDLGCGTGALTATILQLASPAQVRGYDPSPAFIGHARQENLDERAQFEVADGQDIPEPPGRFDAIVSGLVLNFIPEPARAAAEMARLLKPGGTAAAYVWDYAGKMQFMRYFWDAAAALDPTMAHLDEGARFPLCKPGPLEELLREAGFEDVKAWAIDIETRFRDFDDYWTPFLGGTGTGPVYLKSLAEEGQTALREHIRSRLPVEADGSIPLIARAWAVRGLVKA